MNPCIHVDVVWIKEYKYLQDPALRGEYITHIAMLVLKLILDIS